jgi:two-component system sensor histidine kinase/response regulator
VIVDCDPDIVRRVFANLLGNAVKFSPPDEVIAITIADAQKEIKISITDKGYGIAPEYHQKIFDKFGQVEMHKQHQTHSTGLGLTFCRLAVEAHGGKIGVISEPEKGSTFWFTLPTSGGDDE